MQRSCNDQVRSGLLRLFVRLSMIGRTKADDRKKWEKHLEKEEEQCKPRVKKVAAVTQYKLLTQGDVECRQLTDAVLGQRKRGTWLLGMLFSFV